MPTQKPRITFALSENEYSQLEEYRFSHKFKNQSQAILHLINLGLSEHLTSNDSLDLSSAPTLSKEAQELLPKFENLDTADKYRIIGQVEGLLMGDKYQQKSSAV